MNEDNEKEVIENYDEENNDNVLQIILTIILVLVMLGTWPMFVIYYILWLILRGIASKDNILWNAYNKAFKIIGTIALVLLIAFGACTAVLIGGSIF